MEISEQGRLMTNDAFPSMPRPESSLGVNYSFDMDLTNGLTDEQVEQLSDMLRADADLQTLVRVRRQLDTLVGVEKTEAARGLAVTAGKGASEPARPTASQSHSGGPPQNRRRSCRVPVRLAFDVCLGRERLGRYWTHNVSQEGIFLGTSSPSCFTRCILDLLFDADGSEHRLRGIVVHQAPGRGVGVQLAYWRKGDRLAHLAYLRLIDAISEQRAA